MQANIFKGFSDLKALIIILLASAGATECFGQGQFKDLLFSDVAPDGLLSSRSIVLYDNGLGYDELAEAQGAFQQIGIDAVLYFDIDKVQAGTEPARAYAAYLVSREISFLVLMDKSPDGYTIIFTKFNNSATFVDKQQAAWRVSSARLHELMMTVYRDSWLTQKKANFLINDEPEMDINVPVITARRSELYPLDLKIDGLAIVKAGDPSVQSEVEGLLNSIYPFPGKYKFVDSIPENEKDLKRQGVQYVMHYVHCRGKTAKDLLGYDVTRGESAYGSLTFPNGVPQLKTIPVETPVYKFYIKHIESGNVFLGTKWDSDESQVQAMKNYIMAYKSEMKLN
jgi:hypothetical protein